MQASAGLPAILLAALAKKSLVGVCRGQQFTVWVYVGSPAKTNRLKRLNLLDLQTSCRACLIHISRHYRGTAGTATQLLSCGLPTSCIPEVKRQ
jgi:hypothetical protein